MEDRENRREKELGDTCIDRLFTGSKIFMWDLLVSILEISLRMRITRDREERGWVSGRSHMIKKYF